MMKAIFLDRDGTIIKDKNYLSHPSQIEWMPQAVEGLKLLRQKGFELFLITNQSGIGRGYFNLNDLELVHGELNTMMEKLGIGSFKAIEYCPHLPEQQCLCRKPGTQMLERVFNRYNNIDKSKSWMLGDKDIDALCGQKAQINSAIIGKDYELWAKQNKFSYFDDLVIFANTIN